MNDSKKQGGKMASGGSTNNIAPSNRQVGGLASVDWLEYRCSGEWASRRFGPFTLFQLLKGCQAERQADPEKGGYFETGSGDLLRVREMGARSGVMFSFVAECRGVVFLFRLGKDAADVKAVVRLTGAALLGFKDAADAVSFSRRVLFDLGLKVEREAVSRCDIAADVFDSLRPSEVFDLLQKKQVVTRARKLQTNGGLCGDLQTVRLGSECGSTLCRIYDKLAEIATSSEKSAAWVARWGRVPESVTRVEFQLRRETLHDCCNVDTLDQLLRSLDQIVAFCVGDWLRITAEPPDRGNGNQKRAGLHWFWDQVVSVFKSCWGYGERVKRKRWFRGTVEHLKKQVLGTLATLCALECDVTFNVGDVVRDLLLGQGAALKEKAIGRRQALRASGAVIEEIIVGMPPALAAV